MNAAPEPDSKETPEADSSEWDESAAAESIRSRTALKSRGNTIKLAVKPKFYSRHQYFQKLPQFSLDQPCINIASPYIGGEWERYR